MPATGLLVAASMLLAPIGIATASDDADGDGYTVEQGDCDDADPRVSLGHPEACDDNLDNDCDGAVDYQDHDCLVVAEEASGIICECDFPDPPDASVAQRRTGMALAGLLGVLVLRRRPRGPTQ
jgi:MYXO-CTERM domain-containing protein